MAIVLPHVFQDNVNESASGVQVNENFNVLKAAAEALETRATALEALAAHVPSGAYKAVAELGFGPLLLSATRPAFATATSHKPGGNTAFVATILVGGIVVATLADGEYGAGFAMARTASFIVPAGQVITLESPNLAALQPVNVAYILL